MKFLSRFEPAAYALFRLVAGLLFLVHGTQKLFGWPPMPPDHAIHRFSQAWFAGVIELVCGALIAIGLFTRPAAFLASGTMAVAYFQFHWKLQLDHLKWLPQVNMGEAAVLYCFVFLLIACRGAGPYSVERG
jgi:putative oxidoreductase